MLSLTRSVFLKRFVAIGLAAAACAVQLTASAQGSDGAPTESPKLIGREANVVPIYPLQSQAEGEQGKVVLRVSVNANGAVDQIDIKQSSGFSRLDKAALTAVRQWKFIPATLGGQPVAAWVEVPVNFHLQEYLPAPQPK